MNDRYLFRAKRIDNGEWEIGSLICLPNGEYEIANKCTNPPDSDPMWGKCVITHKVDQSTICQCTGLKDKNGKMIWENDITLRTSVTGTHKGKIIYSSDGSFCQKDFETTFENLLIHSDSYFEVIGNIFDNPELINE